MARYVAARAWRRARRSRTHLDRRAAIDGADFVLNMVQIGGHEATLRDFEIPARYGLRQTIADTLGIGGIFRTLRTADHMLALGQRDGRALPAGLAPQLHEPDGDALLARLQGTPTQNVVGLCHSVQYTTEDLAELVGVPDERGHVPRRRASTTRRSSSASSATARASIRASTSGSPPIPSSSAACASRSTAASATSRPSRASTRRSTCRGSCATTTRSSATASRSTSTSAQRGEPRSSTSASRRARAAARRCRSSARTSTPPRSSTRWSPASRA